MLSYMCCIPLCRICQGINFLNSIELKVYLRKYIVRWHVVYRNCIILLRFCVHFSKYFENHALSEMILLRRELGKITFDVDSKVQEYMRTLTPPPQISIKICLILTFVHLAVIW